MTNSPIWSVNPAAAGQQVTDLAGMMAAYYAEVLRLSNSKELALALTVEMQRIILAPAMAVAKATQP